MNNIKVIELAQYQTPEIKESKREDWVEYGENNNYYQYLIDRYTYSPTNSAVINNIVKLIYGKGLVALDGNKHVQDYARLMNMLSSSCLKKVITDLKMLGQASFQVIKSKDRKSVSKMYHIPVHLLRPEKCNEDGEIEAYYYSDNWQDIKHYKPKRIPAFGTSNEEIEILYIQPYSVGMKYFAKVDYQGSLPYALLEEEIADYLINEVQNGFSGTKIVNFNNGVPSDEQMQETEAKVTRKLTGSKGKRVILSFNDDEKFKTTVDDIPLNDAPQHYEYLSDECVRKILLGHNVTSPLLFGISSTNGFSSNADELKNSFILYYNMVIKPYQDLILDAIDEVLGYNQMRLNLYFETLKPLEFSGVTGKAEAQAEEQNAKLSSDLKDLTDEEFELLENDLEGEVIDDEWELVDKREYSEENESVEDWANRLIKEKKTGLQKLADVIKSKPSESSFLDKSYYKVRYEYAEKYSSNNSRKFCKNMMSRTGRGVVYRKEDIDQASFQGVNNSFGHKGQNYSLFKYKGGVNCGHYWSENLYRLKKKTDGSYYEDKSLASSEEVNKIPKTYIPKGKEYETAKVAPKDMPNNGHHPNYKG